MAQRCNVDAIRAAALLNDAPDITDEQDEELAKLFPHYLFFRNEWQVGGRSFACSGCNQHWHEPPLVRTVTPEWRQAMQGKHNQLARCPRCGRVVTLKNEGITRGGDKLWIQIPVLFLLAAEDGGLYGRFALAIKSYRHSRTPVIALEEKARFYWHMPDAEHPKGSCVMARYKLRFDCGTREYRMGWELGKTCGVPWALVNGCYYNQTEEDYRVIGWDQLKQSGLRYCGWRALFGGGTAAGRDPSAPGGPLNDSASEKRSSVGENGASAPRRESAVTAAGGFADQSQMDAGPPAERSSVGEARNWGLCTWLGYYAAGMPQLEFVAKLGLRGFADELIARGKKNSRLLDWRKDRPDRFLRLRPETAKAVLSAGLRSPEELRAAQRLEKQGGRPADIAELMRFAEPEVIENVIEVSALCGVKPTRLCRYIREQAQAGRYKDVQTAGQCWADYINEARALRYDLRQQPVAMPRDLAQVHGTTSGLCKAAGNQALNAAYRERLLPKLRKRYEYDDGTFCILVPTGMEAIIGEGQRLKHCVGGYAERHVLGKTVILFLRASDHKTKSLCTIELKEDGTTIRQIHGFRNEYGSTGPGPRQKYADLLGTWLSWVKAGSPRDKDGNPKTKKRKEQRTA